jgi:hypothetical protein
VNSAQPVRLALSPSRPFACLIFLLHCSAALCILTISTDWAGAAAALLLVALGTAAAWDRALLLSEDSPAAIEVRPGGEAVCILANGATVPVAALGGNGVARAWVALRLASRRRGSLLVAAGMLSRADFRLLRLWALWGRLPSVALRQLGSRA